MGCFERAGQRGWNFPSSGVLSKWNLLALCEKEADRFNEHLSSTYNMLGLTLGTQTDDNNPSAQGACVLPAVAEVCGQEGAVAMDKKM